MNQTTATRELRNLLPREIGAMQALLELLRDESRALITREPGRLEAILAAKQPLVEELATLEARRQRLFDELGLTEPDAVEPFLATLPDAGLPPLWQRLRSLGRECRDWNLKVGATVELARHHVDQLLRILQGRPADAGYGPGGRRQAAVASRLLGQA